MNSLRLEPISSVAGVVNLPGSKSVSNRALLLAALARGTTRLTNLLDSDDIRHMLAALTQLGVKYKLSADKTECTVHGLGRSFAVSAPVNLFLGNAGTAMRPLCAALCLGSGEYMLGGEPRMEERPIGHLVDALREAGAHIQYLKKDGYPPLVVDAKGLWGGDVHVDGSVSSQFLTAFLMAAPMAAGDTRIHIKGELVSKPYIDITLHIMKQFGVVIEHDDYKVFYIKGNQTYVSPGDFLVEGDASSASYFLAAGAIKGKVRVTGIGKHSIQGDIHFADVLEKMGARITWGDDFIEAEQAPLHGVDMDMNHIPDAAMTIAVAALFAKGPTACTPWRPSCASWAWRWRRGVTSSPSPRQRSSSMRPSIPTTITASPCASPWWRCPIPRSPSMIRVVPPRPSRTTSPSWPASARPESIGPALCGPVRFCLPSSSRFANAL